MLTRQGWAALVVAAALVASGRLFGILELVVLGVAAGALVVVALVVVRATQVRIEVRRALDPPRVHAGEVAAVELSVTNAGRRPTPVLSMRDPVGRDQTATVLVPPLPAGSRVQAGYRLPTERRGILPIGPLTVSSGDPFGLAQLTFPGAAMAELTVWPRVEAVPPLPHTIGDEPHGVSERGSPLSSGGDDFHSLRPYVVGDDLRRVHWPTTAKRDELLVRQDEMPWQARATIVLDARLSAHTPETFERAVSAAASVVVACSQRSRLLRLLTSSGFDSGMGEGHAHVAVIMEALATVQLAATTRRDGLAAVVAAVRRPGAGGAVAVFLGTGSAEPVAMVGLRNAVVVRFSPGDDRPFPEVWQRALVTKGTVRAGRR